MEIVTLEQLARIFEVSKRTIANRVRNGELPAPRVDGPRRAYSWPKNEIERIIQEKANRQIEQLEETKEPGRSANICRV